MGAGYSYHLFFFDGEPDKVLATGAKFPAAYFSTREKSPSLLLQMLRKREGE
jgi:hypothetical protein